VKVTVVLSPSRLVPITLPTLTPATRTGELVEMLAEFEKVALTS
jgi:hypothetical protein